MKILKALSTATSRGGGGVVNPFTKADLSQFRRINFGGGNFILLLSATALAACGGGGGGGGAGGGGGGGVSVPTGTTTRLSVSNTGLPSDQRFMDSQAPTSSVDGGAGFDELDLRGSTGADLDFSDNGARNIEIINSRNDIPQELQLSKDDVANFVGSELDDKEILIMRADSNDRISLGDADGWDLADGGLVDYQLASSGSRPQNYNLLQFESENIYIAVPQGVMVTQGDSEDNINTGSFNSNGDNIHFGSAGADNLVGGDGDNFIYGGLGNDTLESGNGENVLWGGAGNDRFFISSDMNDTSHVILDFTSGSDFIASDRIANQISDLRGDLISSVRSANPQLSTQQVNSFVDFYIEVLEDLFRLRDSQVTNSRVESIIRTEASNAGFSTAELDIPFFVRFMSDFRTQASAKELWRQIHNQDGIDFSLVDHANAENVMVKAIQIDIVAGEYDISITVDGVSQTSKVEGFQSTTTIVPDGVDYVTMSSLTDGDITFNDFVSAIGSDALVYI